MHTYKKNNNKKTRDAYLFKNMKCNGGKFIKYMSIQYT